MGTSLINDPVLCMGLAARNSESYAVCHRDILYSPFLFRFFLMDRLTILLRFAHATLRVFWAPPALQDRAASGSRSHAHPSPFFHFSHAFILSGLGTEALRIPGAFRGLRTEWERNIDKRSFQALEKDSCVRVDSSSTQLPLERVCPLTDRTCAMLERQSFKL
ncbi:hypothetical protein LEP1GSC047_1376 [Leptospira inadai serovar Lyme str. 10]|uniref:Uncharacterized protein n=1 Tax=Leptospira inadai serovar Lyme str. 10 TaxID=1049790 RepID=V6HH55_9LEPT|nr:hypothetical protein LEP1GSC047_1376 [Leptospira inadai serovar Lyme str. 10]